MSAKPKINTALLRYRCQQDTDDLMQEVGGIVKCENGLNYAFQNTGKKILAVAHCDSVTCDSDHFFTKDGVVWSTRLDDRLGVFTILDVLPSLGIEVDILLTDGEESCNSTAKHFELPAECDYNWIVQFDRRGTDVVTYQFDEIDPFVKKHMCTPGWGSYSDICELDWIGVAAMNVGIGYHDEHQLGSHAKLWEYRQQIRRFVKFHEAMKDIKIPHDPKTYSYSKGNSSYGTGSTSTGTGTGSQYTSYPRYIDHGKYSQDEYADHDRYYKYRAGAEDAPGTAGYTTPRLTTGAALEAVRRQKADQDEFGSDISDVTHAGEYEDWPCWEVEFKDGKTVKDVYAPDKETAADFARDARRSADDENFTELWQNYCDRDEISHRGSDEAVMDEELSLIESWPEEGLTDASTNPDLALMEAWPAESAD